MKILYFSPISFSGLKQRPQFLAEELSKEHEVIFFDPTISLMKYILKGGEKPKGYSTRRLDNLTIVRLNGFFSAHRCFEVFGRFWGLPERIQLRKYFKKADAVWIGYEPWFDLLPKKYKGKIFYDKMDANDQLTNNKLLKLLIVKTENQLVAKADAIFVSSYLFFEKFSTRRKNVFLLPNAVDLSECEQVALQTKHYLKEEKIYGYVGLLSHWFDWDIVRIILNENTNNRVVLVGPKEIEIPKFNRLDYIGEVPKDEVRGWIKSFDVCICPFKKGQLLDSINPVKIYEYLSVNKPSIMPVSMESKLFGNLVYTYEDTFSLKRLLNGDLEPPFSGIEELNTFIVNNCWETRTQIVKKVIEMEQYSGELQEG